MKLMRIALAALAIAARAGAGCATVVSADPEPAPVIHIEDVASFYKLYDATGGHPTADQLQHYLDTGSDGLHILAKERNVTGPRIAAAIAKYPEFYANARGCMAALPRVKQRLTVALATFRGLYPEMVNEPVTIAVGRTKPVGIADASGVMIGLEGLCAVTWSGSNVEDHFVHTISHEYGHVQQAHAAPDFYNNPNPTVLQRSLIEGAAEFTAELISGAPAEVASSAFTERTNGHEKEIETKFVADEDKTDLSDWLDNSTFEKPGDLGYWVGYR
ncbi:MAG: hypothetical protein WA899_20045, partial [Candidatus Sulfotelmatobacter sp.]